MTLIVYDHDREGITVFSWWRQSDDNKEMVVIGFTGYNFEDLTKPPQLVKLLSVYSKEVKEVPIDAMRRLIKNKKLKQIIR
jgi:hypothetical protein